MVILVGLFLSAVVLSATSVVVVVALGLEGRRIGLGGGDGLGGLGEVFVVFVKVDGLDDDKVVPVDHGTDDLVFFLFLSLLLFLLELVALPLDRLEDSLEDVSLCGGADGVDDGADLEDALAIALEQVEEEDMVSVALTQKVIVVGPDVTTEKALDKVVSILCSELGGGLDDIELNGRDVTIGDVDDVLGSGRRLWCALHPSPLLLLLQLSAQELLQKLCPLVSKLDVTSVGGLTGLCARALLVFHRP
mmetsp:Transcript_43778/g.72981  ORF Transcript_43778/g.72981 Transcript_43778/m.72981 type:complete len:248 (+) Transcript_43778:1243-1986(+)